MRLVHDKDCSNRLRSEFIEFRTNFISKQRQDVRSRGKEVLEPNPLFIAISKQIVSYNFNRKVDNNAARLIFTSSVDKKGFKSVFSNTYASIMVSVSCFVCPTTSTSLS